MQVRWKVSNWTSTSEPEKAQLESGSQLEFELLSEPCEQYGLQRISHQTGSRATLVQKHTNNYVGIDGMRNLREPPLSKLHHLPRGKQVKCCVRQGLVLETWAGQLRNEKTTGRHTCIQKRWDWVFALVLTATKQPRNSWHLLCTA